MHTGKKVTWWWRERLGDQATSKGMPNIVANHQMLEESQKWTTFAETSISDFYPPDCERIHFYCCKAPTWWSFVTAVTGNIHYSLCLDSKHLAMSLSLLCSTHPSSGPALHWTLDRHLGQVCWTRSLWGGHQGVVRPGPAPVPGWGGFAEWMWFTRLGEGSIPSELL